ncbi:D(1)-like dopamine receptor [Gigantopelta aegis]|uniref:D(1)-like dopamine receptor n=1 Tax=Gigantopelta aegis TaxID=1735272 RepID=UPI001B88C825|nr:D(1)-like dopamine receptor [Gigantopelta aegis]
MNTTSFVLYDVFYDQAKEGSIDYPVLHNSSHERGFVQVALFGIFACVWSLVFNSLLILLIVCQSQVRSQFVFNHVISLSISDFLYSSLVDIITAYYDLMPWKLGPHVCKAWMILDVMIPFVSLLIIIILNLDRLLFAISPISYFRLFHRKIFRLAALVLPWIIGSVIVVPLWLLTSTVEPKPGMCIYGITQEAAVTSSVISLFLPCVFIIILTVFILATLIGGLPQDLNEFVSLTFNGSDRTSTKTIKKKHTGVVVALTFVNFFTLVLQLPFGAISILQPECMDPTCSSTLKMLQALSWLRSANPGIRPVFWILITELRHICCSCCDVTSTSSNEMRLMEMTSVTNTNLTNEPILSEHSPEEMNKQV